MARVKRPRPTHHDEDGIRTHPRSEDSDDLQNLPRPLKFVVSFFRPAVGETHQSLDLLDALLYLGILWVALKTPFLYDRETTENFLTPKEFFSKETLALLGALFAVRFIYAGVIKLNRTRLDMPLALFFSLSVLSVAWNYNGLSAIRDLRGTFLIMLLFPLMVNTIKTRWQFEGFLWAMVFTGTATAALGIMEAYNWYFRWDPTAGWFVFARDEIFSGMVDFKAYYLPLFPQLANKNYDMASIISTFGNRNYLGTFTMFTAFIPLSFYFYYKNIVMKAVSMGLFGWMLYGLYITRCRAALIGIVGGIIFMGLMLVLFDRSWKFVKHNAAFFFATAGIVVLGLTVQVSTSRSFNMLDKIQSTFTMDRKTSNTYERVWVWYATFQSFAHNPVKWLIGSGFGSFKHFFPLQEAATYDDDNKETFTAVTFRQTHNDWLQLVSELGLTGLGLFLFLGWRFFKTIVSAVKQETKDQPKGEFKGDHVLLIGLGAAMVSQLLAAGPDFPFHRIETALYAVLVLGLVPILAETAFFKKPMETYTSKADQTTAVALGIGIIVAGFMAYQFEVRCYKADTLVRLSETMLQQQRPGKEVIEAATIS